MHVHASYKLRYTDKTEQCHQYLKQDMTTGYNKEVYIMMHLTVAQTTAVCRATFVLPLSQVVHYYNLLQHHHFCCQKSVTLFVRVESKK